MSYLPPALWNMNLPPIIQILVTPILGLILHVYIYIIGLKSPPIAMIGLTTVRFMIIIPYHDNTYAFHKHYQLTIGHYPIMFGLTLLTTTINTVND
jgi:hypothetical protein